MSRDIDLAFIPLECKQLLVTRVSGHKHHQAQVIALEKREGEWRESFGPFEAVIGTNGITEDKREGDGKTPVGLYPLLAVFGWKEHQVRHMPFISIHGYLEAIDDPASRYYNQIVDCRLIHDPDWQSSEKMQEVGSPYEIGVVIGYNMPYPIAGKGSCIFLHVFQSIEAGTAGCIALPLQHVKRIAEWLRSDLSPHIFLHEL